MSKSQKLFRYLWRINAVVICVAAGFIAVGAGYLLIEELGRTARHVSAKVDAKKERGEDPRLHLTAMSNVPGTDTLRAELVLHEEEAGFGSSSGRWETHNILFLEPHEKAARWLLPDNQHVILKDDDILESRDSKIQRTLATPAIIRSSDDTSTPGVLILFDPTGRKRLDISKGVDKIHSASIFQGKISIVYERHERLIRTLIDPASFAKLQEDEIEVPALKPVAPEDNR